jgi:hypothetical protein
MNIGKLLIISGTIFICLGLFLLLGGRLPNLGHLKGDLIYKTGNVTIYFPITTCLILSLLLSLLFYFARR